MAKRKKRTKYQMFQDAARKYCENPTDKKKATLKKREEAYKKDAMEKGKKSSELRSIISRVKKCPANIGRKTGRKRRK